MNWVKTHKFIPFLFPKYIWKINNSTNKVYLTFDDGPIPIVTEWVLDVLKTENIKATFFCIGENIQKHPEVFKRIVNEGHNIGNHTYNHLNGWETKNETYLDNFDMCKQLIKTSNIFRPPYGKISPLQAKKILQKKHKIIMWDVLSYDFGNKISSEKCLNNVVKNTESGSIIVFHDSIKAEQNLRYALPKAITYLKEKGFEFDVIS
ncbi:polysaccharide deacetylase family protein [Flavobacterium okayamense]|uniref:Polysaccharide deacetylase n=1 Tax=Flavobacterium okayamense TaxID=2830782 RepID=A0ABM7SBG0_9FLAO|nr:polysaccharide deacetylase family protein [Flavobacterium okayamense]BCY28122.1 polysaccharide deacetylase [Flavobacterium okayamense]